MILNLSNSRVGIAHQNDDKVGNAHPTGLEEALSAPMEAKDNLPLLTDIRWRTIISIAIILPIGLLYSHYRFSVAWLNQEVGGVFYEIFWCLFAFLFLPTRRAVWQIPLWVLVITCLLEFLQLWQTPFLVWVRSFWVGRMLFGNAFTWADFPYYFIGSGLGWLWLKLIILGTKRI